MFVIILLLATTLSEFMILVRDCLNPLYVAIMIAALVCLNSSLLINQ